MAISARMKAIFQSLGMVAAACLLAQCASFSSGSNGKGKEAYGKVLPEIRAPQSLNYQGLTYMVGYSAANKNGVLVEYFPVGEDSKSWTQMLALRSIEKPTTPQQEVAELERAASARGGSLKKAPGSTTADCGVSFTIQKPRTTEFNMFRYTQGSGATTASLQYAAVLPPETVRLGSGALNAVAEKHAAAVMRLQMPEIGRQ